MRPPRRRLAVLFFIVLCLCLAGLGTVSVGTAAPTGAGPSPQQDADAEADAGGPIAQLEGFDADQTVFVITVREDGDAEWRFVYERRLENETDVADFRAYAERFNTEETETFRNFRERATALAASGNDSLARNMSAERFRRDARVEPRPPAGEEFAVVEMSFVWRGFAATDGAAVTVSDVFVGGLYVGPNQRLRFEPGPNLQFESAEPQPDSTAGETLAESESVRWVGERQFTDRQPRVAFVDRDGSPDASPGSDGGDASDAGADGDGLGPGALVGAGIVIVVVLAVGAAVALASRSGPLSAESETAASSDDAEAGPAADAGNATPAPSDTDAASAGTASTDSSEDDGGDATDALPEEPVLSDEQRVVSLLDSEGGRMRQAEIVERTGWSKSKVSMQLSEMEADGTVSKLRVGRENIVSLAGHEPDAAGSPFDDGE